MSLRLSSRTKTNIPTRPCSIPARDHRHGRKFRKDPGVGGIFGNCVSPSPCTARVSRDFIFDESYLGTEDSIRFCRVWRNRLTSVGVVGRGRRPFTQLCGHLLPHFSLHSTAPEEKGPEISKAGQMWKQLQVKPLQEEVHKCTRKQVARTRSTELSGGVVSRSGCEIHLSLMSTQFQVPRVPGPPSSPGRSQEERERRRWCWKQRPWQ